MANTQIQAQYRNSERVRSTVIAILFCTLFTLSFFASYQTLVVEQDFEIFTDPEEVPEPTDVILYLLTLTS